MKKRTAAVSILAVCAVFFLSGCASLVEMAERENLRAAEEREAREARAASRDTTYGITDKVGTVGPAGGLIFFDKGNNDGGWQFLEAAPKGAELSDVVWGLTNVSIPLTLESPGSGKANTAKILESLGNRTLANGEYQYAARVVTDLSYGGYSDWYIPSIVEVEAMMYNLRSKGLGDFTNDHFMSSSQHLNSESQYLGIHADSRYTTGTRVISDKDAPTVVRPVRRF